MLQKCERKFYRTKAIFKEDAKSIYERCEAENGDALITTSSKKLYEELLKQFDNFEKIYE